MFEESVSFIPSIWASVNSWFTPTVLFVFLNLMIGTIAITSSLASTQKQRQQQQQQQQQHQHQQQQQYHDQHAQQFARSPSMLQRLKSINFYNYRSPEPNTNFAQTQGTDAHFTFHFNREQEREQEQEQDQERRQHQWNRSPSMLQRLKSINLNNYISQESSTLDKTQEADTHYSPNQFHEEEHRLPEAHQELEKAAEQQHQEEEVEEEEEEEDHIQDQEQTLDEIYNQVKGSNVSRTKSDTKPASGEMPKKLPKKMRKSASSKSAFSHFKEEDVVEIEARRPATVRESGNPKMTQVDDEGVDAKADDFINKFKQQLKLQRIDSIIRYKEMINKGAGM
ncbi:DUF761 domain-containing protein/DUF4408 domain-containing protein [Melia azedarach]|uniref:DUF761 domain-containing protein/DUF4408 domain-containing protein n=1 Tax=Melia azedarach TaxID=155640 RepID=A0ACC1XAS4_MELAZ|nr:DUF761 domain-containing protein/DUF4408 domain-containing protein [Melia azedarach]